MRCLALVVVLASGGAAGAATAPVGCAYAVDVSAALMLDVSVTCDGGVEGFEAPDRFSRGHLTDISSSRDGERFAGRYRLDLAAMAREHATVDGAVAIGESILVVAASWLLRPRRDDGRPAMLDVRVTTPPGVDFVTAQPTVDGVFRIPQSELALAGYAAFGRLRRHPMRTPAPSPARYEVVVLDGAFDLAEQTLVDWIGANAAIMSRFWRGFPAPGLTVFVLPRPGADGVLFGRDMSGGGISTVLIVGERTTRAQLADDWILIHELVHVGSPFVRGAPWLTEGLATYLEPLIRARHGLQSPAAMWTEFITHMPRGAAVIGDTGLARGGFRGWYWGGGLLMLLADVEMRRASGGRVGLEDCLRTVRERLGNYLRTIGLDEMVGACDAAVGGRILAGLVARHAAAATPVDLAGLWRDLGVSIVDGMLEFDPSAPLAGVREAVVRGGVEASN